MAPAIPPADIPAIADELAGSSITAAEVDAVLRDGGNSDNTLLRIAAYYMKDKPLTDNADFLSREYVKRYQDGEARLGGKGFQFGNEKLAAWFDDTGITLGRGDTATQAKDRVHLSWEQAAVRVRELLDAGAYISGDLLDEAVSNEHRELADRLLFFYRDDLRDFRERPEAWRAEKGGWPDDVAKLKSLIDNPEEYGLIMARLEEDVAALYTDPDAPTRFWHSPSRMLEDMRDAGIAPLYFPHTDLQPPAAMRFITQDEIDAYLIGGSHFHSGKYRILSYFLEDHTGKERAAFLKNEYGHGGSSHALGGADDSWADYEPGKGILLKRGSVFDEQAYDTVKLTWSAAEKRVMGLIQSGRYMSRAALDNIPAYEKQELARYIQNFYYNLPPDFERPYPSRGFIDDEATGAIRDMLESEDRGEQLLAAMTPIMDGTPPDDRLYATRKNAYDSLIAYREGNFHLFPGLDALPPPEAVTVPPVRRVEQAPEQLTLFSDTPAAPSVTPPPVLRGVEEQQARIEQAVRETEREPEPPAADIISQGEIDALLLGAVETTDQFDAILAQFADNFRSREAVQLIKDIYSDGVYLMHRIDGAEGYMGLAGDASGVTLSKSDPPTIPKEERQPSVTVDLPWPKVHRRVAELVESGRFLETRNETPTFHSPKMFIPYREGDSVDTLREDGSHVRLVLNTVGERYVEYTFPDAQIQHDPIQAPRSRFEEYLDSGRYTIMEPGARLPSQDSIESELAEPVAAENLTDTAEQSAETVEQAAPALDTAESPVPDSPGEAPPKPAAPEPVFFVDWEAARADFDLRLYNDGDVVGYDKDGVKYAVSRSDSHTFISSTGMFWGENSVPGNIYEQITAYLEGSLTDEQVRENYLQVLSASPAEQPEQPTPVDYLAANLDAVNSDLIDVLETGLLSQEHKDSISELIAVGKATNDELVDYLSMSFPREAETMTLETGETADYFTTPHDISIEIQDKYNSRRGFTWIEVAPILRALDTRGWQIVEPAAEQAAVSEPDMQAPVEAAAQPEQAMEPEADATAYAMDDIVYLDGDRECVIRWIGNDQVDLHDTSQPQGVSQLMDKEGFERQLRDNPRNNHLFGQSEPDFDTVAQTVLARVMRDTDYLADLAAAPSRAMLRNPCTWALEQAIRDHEQDEPAVYQKYFFDDEWNDRLFSYVLRESYAGRPQPEILPEPQAQENAPDAEPDDDFSDIDPVAIRERLQNPTPEDVQRLNDMLAFAEQTAADFDAALGIEPDTRSEQEIIDDALREWNGSIESKALVYQYMREHGRERGTAAFLQTEFAEYADNLTDHSVFHVSMPSSEAQRLPWPKVQRRIAQLIEADAFLNPAELDYVEREYDFADPDTYDGPTRDDLIRSELQDVADLLDPEDMEEPVWHETGSGETTHVMFDLMPDTSKPEAQPEGGDHSGEALEEPPPPAPNYRITDDNLGAGGPKTRFAANIAAIRILGQIENEGRGASRPEQEILARYVGWGGLDKAFDDGDEKWQNEYAELKALLTPEEYSKAQSSVLNAHYTPPVVVKAIYDAIGQMGFQRGNVLEPSCGTGNFFGLVPEEMKGAKLYGVELDDLSARIAEKLYPSANILNRGFEKTNFPDSFFDVVVGNVPFGDYKVYDQDYNRNNFFIHDYFIAKSIDKVRARGVVALVTSNGVSGGTFDKRDSKARRYMAERCDLIGAIRLPDNTFKAAAGTDMTTDILFLQKREVPRDLAADMPDWVGVSVVHEHQHEQADGEMRNNVLTINNYYQQHPEMVLGNLEVESGPFGPQLSCKLGEGELADRLREAVSHLQADITVAEPTLDDLADSAAEGIPADPNVKNFSYTLVDDRVYYRENSVMYPMELPATTLERIHGMIELRDCVHKLIDMQLNDYADFAIKDQQQRLDGLYDAFVAEYGLLNSVANSRAFSGDSAYYLLCSLEILDENNNLERKADMFTKRTIKQRSVITSVDTASEALAVSIGERARVDMEFMRELTGFSEEKLAEDLRGVIFRYFYGFPDGKYTYRSADEFLSGNVHEKLAHYRRGLENTPESHPQYPFVRDCAEALEKAIPKDLEASEIAVRLGSTWVDKSYVQQFMYELLQSPYNIQNICKVNYSDFTGEWQVTGKGRIPMNNVAAHFTYGTERRNAYEIIEDTLNLRDVRVYDTKTENGKDVRVLNKKQTTLAQQKQEQIKQAFKDWIWQDPQRRQRLVRQYNDLFNSNRPREYDGSHIVFSGMNPEFSMRSYQANAIARVLYGGNTLLSHEVGAGKTFEMVAAAMEGKRLGLCNKSMFAVPNHIIDQIASDFLRLYPSANILVAQKKDFEMRNRKKFCAKIATGDYDAVIIGHSQLEKIPISMERQERLLDEQLMEVLEGIEEVKRAKGERFTIKQLERTKKRLEMRLEKIREGKKRDDVVTFEQLGVDRLFVDEAHNYKNLFLYTKMRNVAGLSTTEAQKSNDLFLKCRYMDELTKGKGVIFATGTPVSNSMTELYTMQRYLQYDNLERKNLIHFDSWASIFGETVTAMELAPEGTGYRARTRFSRFHNLPELMGMFGETADIKTADTLDLVRPTAHFETVVVQPSELQKEMVQALSERAAEVHTGRIDPKEDNMLKITSDGRKIGLDQRLIDPLLPDFEGSKVNACMGNIHRIWENTKANRLAQLVFCDFSTPNKDGRFNVYDDIKKKLKMVGFQQFEKYLNGKGVTLQEINDYIASGMSAKTWELLSEKMLTKSGFDFMLNKCIPEHEIAFIHDANTDAKKKELFAKVRKGQVRVLFGSTFKMGAGTNVQDKLIAMHDLDCPWRPADLEQRAGRIVRFGNQNPDVFIYRYVTEGTFDAYLWQTVENKQKFISQIMTSKSPVRACEDVDETALSYAEIKALCSGNPLIKEKIDLDIEVARLRLLKSEHQSQHHRLEDDLLGAFPKNIKSTQENIAGLERDVARYERGKPKEPPIPAEPVAAAAEADAEAAAEAKPQAAKAPFAPMTVMGTVYTEKEAAGKALLEACKSVKSGEPVPVGSYMGFDMSIAFESYTKKFRLTLKGDMSYNVDMGVDPFGNLTRMNHALRVDMPERLASNRVYLENLYQQVEGAKKELQNPFSMEKELAEKEMRLALVNAELNIEDGHSPLEAAVMGEAESAKQKPSILDGLRARHQKDTSKPRQDKTPETSL